MSLKIVEQLKPISFRYNDIFKNIEHEDNRIHYGFLAQDLFKLFGPDHSIVSKNGDTGYLVIDEKQLIAPLVKAVQELMGEVHQLKQELNKLNGDH